MPLSHPLYCTAQAAIAACILPQGTRLRHIHPDRPRRQAAGPSPHFRRKLIPRAAGTLNRVRRVTPTHAFLPTVTLNRPQFDLFHAILSRTLRRRSRPPAHYNGSTSARNRSQHCEQPRPRDHSALHIFWMINKLVGCPFGTGRAIRRCGRARTVIGGNDASARLPAQEGRDVELGRRPGALHRRLPSMLVEALRAPRLAYSDTGSRRGSAARGAGARQPIGARRHLRPGDRRLVPCFGLAPLLAPRAGRGRPRRGAAAASCAASPGLRAPAARRAGRGSRSAPAPAVRRCAACAARRSPAAPAAAG